MTTLTGDHAHHLISRGRLVRRRTSGDIFVSQLNVPAVVEVGDDTLSLDPGDYLAHDKGDGRTFVIREAEFARDYVFQKPGAQKPRGKRAPKPDATAAPAT